MKQVISYVYTHEDKVLLSKPLPDDPCQKKCEVPTCCGCPEKQAYDVAIQPYKEAGILDIALKLQQMQHLEQEARSLAAKYNELHDSIPEFAKPHKITIQRGWY